MRSFQNKIKNYERHYGVHLRSLSRSRRFVTLFMIVSIIILFILYNLSTKSTKYSNYSVSIENCISLKLEKFRASIESMNTVVSEWPMQLSDVIKKDQNIPPKSSDQAPTVNDDLLLLDSEQIDYDRLYLPYTGNGYIGLAINSKMGLFANHLKGLSLELMYNPLSIIYSDNLEKKEVFVNELYNGIVNKIQCYQNENHDCISVTNTVYAHRTRPSLLVEEIVFNNPTRDSFTFDVIQLGSKNWNLTKMTNQNFNNMEFTITRGVIDLLVDNKLKHLCISIGSTKLASNVKLKDHDFNSKYTLLTAVKYSTTYLGGKIENLEPILDSLDAQVIHELKEATNIGFGRLKKEHIAAWNNIWKSGFEISNSLADGALNGNRINSTIYYLLTNTRAPLMEVAEASSNSTTDSKLEYHVERCYEGFSTLHALKLWKLPLNENEIISLNSLWTLTLQKHGCKLLIEVGVDGVLQSVILSLGGLKFTHHHLDLNLNPRQLHRDYFFRRINYANQSYLTVEVVVDSDNHAKLYATLNELIDSKQKFFACDGGCIDEPVELELNERKEFPVKLTNPPTAILYISSDKVHIDELQHTLHVQEVDIAPPQDVNSIAIHKHGHHMAGFATLFWTLFVFLIIIFHLFLFKLIYRELCGGSWSAISDKNSNSSSNYNKKYRFARTV